MNEVFVAAIVAMAGIWLAAFLTAPWLGRNSQIECAAVGVSERDYVAAVRIRATINILVTLACGAAGAFLASMAGVDPLIGGALGVVVSIPLAYLVLASANKALWVGFNDKVQAVRRRRRERLAEGAR